MQTPGGESLTTAASKSPSGSSPSPTGSSPGANAAQRRLSRSLSRSALGTARAGSSTSPLTARRKKNCRFMCRELGNVIGVMERMLNRTELAKQCCDGVLAEVRRAEASARKQLGNNSEKSGLAGQKAGLNPVFKMLRAMRDESEKGAVELEGQLEVVTNHFALIEASIAELKLHHGAHAPPHPPGARSILRGPPTPHALPRRRRAARRDP